ACCRSNEACCHESHQRQLVDASDPFYTTQPQILNPTYGSGWIVQILSTNIAPHHRPRIPPMAVGGCLQILSTTARSSIEVGRFRKWRSAVVHPQAPVGGILEGARV